MNQLKLINCNTLMVWLYSNFNSDNNEKYYSCNQLLVAHNNDRNYNIVLGVVLDDGKIIQLEEIDKIYKNGIMHDTNQIYDLCSLEKYPIKDINNLDFSDYLGDYILAINKDGNSATEIKKFNTIEETNHFVNTHFKLDTPIKFDSLGDYIECNDGNLAFTLKSQECMENILSYLRISNLSYTYSGLRYNGVDYECEQVLEFQNKFGNQILGFICNDGEIININDPFLDGIFLIEGDDNKKFNAQFLIQPFEVDNFDNTEIPLDDENFIADYIVAINESGTTCPQIHSFITYKNMIDYLKERKNFTPEKVDSGYGFPNALDFGEHYVEFNNGQFCVSFSIAPINFFHDETHTENLTTQQKETQEIRRRM